MISWINKRLSVQDEQQTVIRELQTALSSSIVELKEERAWSKKVSAFTENINLILSQRSHGTKSYYLKGLDLVLVVTRVMKNKIDFFAYAPFMSGSEVASAFTSIKEDNSLDLEGIWVEKSFQRMGIGRVLLTEIIFESNIRKLGKITTLLEGQCVKDKDRLINFYARHGFIPAEEQESMLVMHLDNG